jgi:23S rRNA (pseudouridine1915-N3)-methyltransferase
VKITIASVGKPSRLLERPILEFETRAARYWKMESADVSPEKATRNRPVEEVRAAEAERIRAAAPTGTELVALTRTGSAWSSRDLARYLHELAVGGAAGATFIVGGAYGLDPGGCSGKRTGTISLSALTMPHDLARFVLAEQLYRAGTIVRGRAISQGLIGRGCEPGDPRHEGVAAIASWRTTSGATGPRSLLPRPPLRPGRPTAARPRRSAAASTGDALPGWPEAVRPSAMRPPEKLARIAQGDGFFVTTGQQPGLFGGPSTPSTRPSPPWPWPARLEAVLRCAGPPLFWIASDDHDWDEANHTSASWTPTTRCAARPPRRARFGPLHGPPDPGRSRRIRFK